MNFERLKSLALVRCEDTSTLEDFKGYYFKILGWNGEYLKIQDVSGIDRLPLVAEGQDIPKFETVYDLMKYVRRHENTYTSS